MRLVTYALDDSNAIKMKIGAFVDNDATIVSLTDTDPAEAAFSSMLGLIESGEAGLAKARQIVADSRMSSRPVKIESKSVKLMAPVPKPESIRDWACFPEHYINAKTTTHRRLAAKQPDPEAALEQFRREGKLSLPADYYELPRFHACNRHNVVGHEAEVVWPPFSEEMDFELEFGFFIGKKGRDIREAEARDYIFGFTIFNDFTARDFQRREARIGGKCKEFDGGNVLGPCLVTRDDVPDPYNLRLIARVNGEVVTDSNSNTIGRSFEQLIAHMSESTTLYPGEFFGSGTVGGGCGLEFDRYLRDGDVVELEVESIGVLRNRIVRRSIERAS